MKNLLIVDDEEINRISLETGLSGIYNTILAESGKTAFKYLCSDLKIDAILLDLNMTEISGFDVLRYMSKVGMIHNIPVFVITGSDDNDQIQEAFNIGAVDVITKPYNIQILIRRIANTLELFEQRNNLEEIVEQKIAQNQMQNNRLVEIMANMVEFRSKESGLHVKRVRGYTKLLMEYVVSEYSEYKSLKNEIENISFAACLHDIGKNSIPDAILGKPGKLDNEEFQTMKTHTLRGYEQLLSMRDIMDPRLFRYSLDIARHHHERYDGKGYPDNLEGDDITIWAQAVGIADVYDALTTERCYKEAYSHEKAVSMILNGECGKFSPQILASFSKMQNKFNELRTSAQNRGHDYKKKLLIIDDSEIDRYALNSILKSTYDLTIVDNGKKGISLVKENPYGFDGIITDLNMPEMDGFTVLKNLGKKICKEIPIMMMSSECTIENLEKADSFGVSVFLRKPFDSELILQKVKMAMK